jgi:hypothetical protein
VKLEKVGEPGYFDRDKERKPCDHPSESVRDSTCYKRGKWVRWDGKKFRTALKMPFRL